jgi:quinol monooxygenase YgiN
MLGVVATVKVKPGRDVDQAAVEAHRASEHFRTLGRKLGEYMDGRPEVVRVRGVD